MLKSVVIEEKKLKNIDVCLICGFTSQSTTMVISRWSVNLTTLFLGRIPKHIYCTKRKQIYEGARFVML